VTSPRYQTDPAYRAHVDAIAARKPPVTAEEIAWLRETLRAGRELARRQQSAPDATQPPHGGQ